MTTLTLNQELNGIEVKFDAKPLQATLDELKKLGFRWHKQKKLWYAKNTPECMELAKKITGEKEDKAGMPKSQKSANASRQKELKEKYMQIICAEVWKDAGMQEYARKECGYIVELSNRNIICIEKPRIKKDFCFGMGMYGTYTDDDFNRAENCAENARTNENYFISENLKEITEKINALSECLAGKLECYTYTHYIGQPENSLLKGYTITRTASNPEYEPGKWSNMADVQKIGIDDIQKIIDGLEVVKERFEKRLHTYLKKYGLSKLNVWTYCRD